MSDWNDLVSRILATEAGGVRTMIAIAGPPAAGKSSISERLQAELAAEGAEILPMDGFHYDNAVLDQLGLRQRKGAPQTFDFDNFELTLRRVRDSTASVAVPTFDRPLDLSRAGARLIAPSTRYVIVEGNYLLLDRAPWSGLARLFDLTVFLTAPRAELERRLLKRWTDLSYPDEYAVAKVRGNDLPNVDLVLEHSMPADVTWESR
ncbi:nucleoside/nucleotide kinase family protein [Mesorhizobium sp. M2C.T.Ca.TU.002.02.1.1]|jgi:pantothenate kinase|uniref:nucleoside/nucleotide kinase family protein n=1 Tax=Mesorhizobium sp. M2C.T.Ca.TU.002.02.1.1 TaxID=2496788 RepID=UPI000FCC8B13|nr:nucleoside/nucleotide kinase family protein [Mesorhizobium sp. M2C.T.Ca.TU.002.02.1.1]RUU51862.1 nucleoside/nucleotide kinase family protein [Mesorhizobium sp. M2C.T.Ca.TU.002.02.1.1]RUU52045.1 nucleoside/nucleotide kinase family protein [Mesorhizobium sp. M2C.T.Ca.TU.009.01.2.1]